MDWRVVSSTPRRYPPDANSRLPIYEATMSPDISLGPWVGQYHFPPAAPIENHCPRRRDEFLSFSLCINRSAFELALSTHPLISFPSSPLLCSPTVNIKLEVGDTLSACYMEETNGLLVAMSALQVY